MGGCNGIGEHMGFATELQGDGTCHAHGFVCLTNVFQHSSLADIAALIVSRYKEMAPEEIIDRLKRFMDHVSREDHLLHEQHVNNEEIQAFK